MAIVFIKSIKGRLENALWYISNKRKTENDKYEDAFLDLHNELNYTTDDIKTEQQFYVSGINCKPENAYERMITTKANFHKTGGILGFHLIQSFAKDEGTPETIHELGKQFAKEIWGNDFEVVVSTHLNTGCLHNHYIINSVSSMDGRKYYDNKETYARLREVSDKLCLEYGLSVIEKPKTRSHKNYALYMAEKNGEPTKNSIIRQDIDECILISLDQKDFFNNMKKRGYTFDFSHKYATISHPKFSKARRLSNLGDDYTPASLKRRIDESWRRYKVDIPQQENLVEEYFTPIRTDNYREVYIRFVTVTMAVKKKPNSNRRLHKVLFDEICKLDKLIEQQNLLCGNDIDTPEQLAEFKQSCNDEITELEQVRYKLRNKLRVAVRNGDEKDIEELKDHISNLSERLKKLRRDIFVCERIENQKPVLDEKIQECNEMTMRKEKTRNEHIRRSR